MKKIILGIVVLIILGGGAYFFVSQKSESPFSETIKDIKETLSGGPNTSDWQTYTSSARGFRIKYPPDYEVRGESEGVFFIPPELKDTTKPPETLKKLPLGALTPPNQSYGTIAEEIKKQSEGASYSEETAKVILGVQGIELKLGPKLGSGDNLHKLYNIIPYKDGVLIFLTFATSKEQLKGQGVPLLDAFISTFTSE